MIEINDKYYITGDGYNVMLRERGVVQDKNSKNYGEPYDSVLGYYGSVEYALKSFVKKEIRKYLSKEESNTVKELLAEVDRLNNQITELFKKEIK